LKTDVNGPAVRIITIITGELLLLTSLKPLRKYGFADLDPDPEENVTDPRVKNIALLELVFLNLYGAQESMPRHQLRQPM
jgi:hypothetical protein